MTDVEARLVDALRARAEAAEPDFDLDAVRAGRSRSGTPGDGERSAPHRVLLVAAVALIVIGVGALVMVLRPETPAPVQLPPVDVVTDSTPSAPVGVSPVGFAAVRVADGRIEADGWSVALPNAEDVVTDMDMSAPSASYFATCCAPEGQVYRFGGRADRGAPFARGTRFDYCLDRCYLNIAVDPISETYSLGDPSNPPRVPVDEPGVLDGGFIDVDTLVLLRAAPSPELVLLTRRDEDWGATPDRRTIALPSGSSACGLVALESSVVLLEGEAVGLDTCVGDRVLLVDPLGDAPVQRYRLPAPVRQFNSDRLAHVVAVTVDGDVVLGAFADAEGGAGTSTGGSTDVTWMTIAQGDYVAAALW